MIPIEHSMNSAGGILVCKGDQGATACQTPVIYPEKQQNTFVFFQRAFYNIDYPVDLIFSWMMIPKAKLVRWDKIISFNDWFQPSQEKFFKQFR